MCQYTICHLYLSEWSKWRKIKRNSVFRSMFVFMFRYLLQNVAKMTESTPSRHCLPWKHFMQYAYTCLQGFYVKIVYFITSYDPSFILQYLVVVLGTSRSQEIVGHFRRGRKQQALNKGKVCPIPTCSLETKREIEKGKKRRKENLGIIWDRNSFQVCLPTFYFSNNQLFPPQVRVPCCDALYLNWFLKHLIH